MKCKQCHNPRPNHKLDCSHPGAQVDRLQNMVESLGARLAAWEPVVRAACEWAGDDGASEEGIYHAVRALPKEHRP